MHHSQVIYTHVFRDDRSLIPVAPDFAFGERGRIDIKLKGGCRHQQTRQRVRGTCRVSEMSGSTTGVQCPVEQNGRGAGERSPVDVPMQSELLRPEASGSMIHKPACSYGFQLGNPGGVSAYSYVTAALLIRLIATFCECSEIRLYPPCVCCHNHAKGRSKPHYPSIQPLSSLPISDITIWQRHEDEHDVSYDNFGFFLSPVVREAAWQAGFSSSSRWQ